MLASLTGGSNLVENSFPAKGAESSIENIISLNPDFYLLTAADWQNFNRRSTAVKLSYGADATVAKFMHPQTFTTLEPEQNLQEFLRQFTAIKTDGVFWISL